MKHRFRFSAPSRRRLQGFDAQLDQETIKREQEASELFHSEEEVTSQPLEQAAAAPAPEDAEENVTEREDAAQSSAADVSPAAAEGDAAPRTKYIGAIDSAGFSVAYRSDVGKVRANNQDAFILASPLYGVADGMGGHQGGETASAMCRDEMIRLMLQEKDEETEDEGERLCKAVRITNRRIFMKSLDEAGLNGMGTTLTALLAGEDRVWIAHVGDSRCYLYRDGTLTQVTNDHSMVMEMVRSGYITVEQALTHPMRNVITRAVGTERSVQVDLIEKERKQGDIWLLCSDGLTGPVKDDTIQELLEVIQDEQSELGLEEIAESFLQLTLSRGAPDNVTFVILVDREASHGACS
ncbi:MAG: Stp1/IreP family PP2C-type Ser/Thr phosphatase [Clostridia bacterium]|nr:Stp1/IreP family PP2C-type Ser/Thr phosphatase [Clostridia bacterium]